MRILALNSSPRAGAESRTGLLLEHLIKGMRDAGAEVEVTNLRDKTVRNCVGCFICFTKTPGRCVHNDDMTKDLFPKWLESDLVVYATPLYSYGMTTLLKAFVERTLPSMEPFFEIHEGRMFHPVRNRYPPAVVLAVSGMPDAAQFAPLSAQVRYFFSSPGRKLVAEIYRTAAEMMNNPCLKEKTKEVLDATAQAGRELIQSMAVSPEIIARITQPLVDPQFFAKMGNVTWKTCIAEGVTIKEFAKRKIVPRPDSLESFLFLFPLMLHSETVREKKVVQFNFSGDVRGSCYFTIIGGVNAQSGISDNPDLIIETPFEVWMDIVTGKTDGQKMLMERKYKVFGDLHFHNELVSEILSRSQRPAAEAFS